MISVMLADAQPLTRMAIRTLLTADHDLVLLSEATTNDETLRLCQETRPDILLLANSITGSSLMDTISFLHQSYPKIKILILTNDCSKVCIRQLMSAGAVGCIMKNEPPQSIILAIHSAAKGATWFSQAIAENFVQEKIVTALSTPSIELTQREQETLGIIAKGMSNKEIAYALCIKEKTVEYHVSNILRKLRVQSRTAAALWARENDIRRDIDVRN